VKVEIWSDVVCPWCYVGKRRLEAALARFDRRHEVDVVWRSFELDPSAPPSDHTSGSYARRLAHRYGTTTEQAQVMIDNMTALAASEGLDMRFDEARPGNTFDAHRLLHLALDRDLQNRLKDRLDGATFSEGLSVSNHDELTRIAVEAGLDEREVKEVLSSDRYADAVRDDERRARAHGISGVPFFVVDRKYGVAGAQPSELLLDVLTRAWAERFPTTSSTIPAPS
jgi:predicted DsbA family dithiol-disulfide isomerase